MLAFASVNGTKSYGVTIEMKHILQLNKIIVWSFSQKMLVLLSRKLFNVYVLQNVNSRFKNQQVVLSPFWLEVIKCHLHVFGYLLYLLPIVSVPHDT